MKNGFQRVNPGRFIAVQGRRSDYQRAWNLATDCANDSIHHDFSIQIGLYFLQAPVRGAAPEQVKTRLLPIGSTLFRRKIQCLFFLNNNGFQACLETVVNF